MTRVFLYIFIIFFIFACDSKTGKEALEKINDAQLEEYQFVKKQNVKLEEKCFKDTAANLIFQINVEQAARLIVKDIYDDVIIDYENVSLNINSVHKDFGDRYFLLCNSKDNSLEIWEVEISTGNIMFVDIDTSSINNTNVLLKCD